jgi:hypothetical protein
MLCLLVECLKCITDKIKKQEAVKKTCKLKHFFQQSGDTNNNDYVVIMITMMTKNDSGDDNNNNNVYANSSLFQQ